ncbi:MAG: hypothetical protein R2712_06350 [Vicinamibacterales bacterium]
MPWKRTALALAVTLGASLPVSAQITLVEGAAAIDRGHVRTAGGRVELVGPAGALIHVDAATDVDAGPARVVLHDGRLVIRTAALPLPVSLPFAELSLDGDGTYALLADARGNRLLVEVRAGAALLRTRYASTVRIGPQQLAMMTSATSVPWAAPAASRTLDAFDAWSTLRAAASPAVDGRDAPVVMLPPAGCGSRELPCGWSAPWPHRGTSPPTRPGYAPNYGPNYAPNYAPAPAPGERHARPSRHRPETPPAPTATPPPATPPPAAPPAGRGRGAGLRIPPERPEQQ